MLHASWLSIRGHSFNDFTRGRACSLRGGLQTAVSETSLRQSSEDKNPSWGLYQTHQNTILRSIHNAQLLLYLCKYLDRATVYCIYIIYLHFCLTCFILRSLRVERSTLSSWCNPDTVSLSRRRRIPLPRNRGPPTNVASSKKLRRDASGERPRKRSPEPCSGNGGTSPQPARSVRRDEGGRGLVGLEDAGGASKRLRCDL